MDGTNNAERGYRNILPCTVSGIDGFCMFGGNIHGYHVVLHFWEIITSTFEVQSVISDFTMLLSSFLT